MKERRVVGKSRRPTISLKHKTHEERRADDIFVDDLEIDISTPNTARTSVNVDPPEDRTEEVYNTIDYGLSADDSAALWNKVAGEKARQFEEIIITMLATLDGLQGVEEHLNKTFNAGLANVTKEFVTDVDGMLQMRLRSVILDTLGFQVADEKLAAFTKHVLHFRNRGGEDALSAVRRFINENSRPDTDSPYGVVKSLKDKDR
ncbi:hypothetical protein EVB87_230 [Rhizobium phage RHph_N28_1]|nr:hypothetical protein EVB87_230 [Rhizobium phage RHph_N28_1]QIG74259.1 hypothetical protein EVC07_231 [Rhizobium phage RHph_N42]QXV73919.1 hypothetical protein [Rhizobium phage RHph_N46]